MNKFGIPALLTLVIFIACNKNEVSSDECSDQFFCEYDNRNFQMGFSTWPYAPTLDAVEGTYEFIETHSDIYSEHIDSNIPWDAWINDTELPAEFVNEITGKASHRIDGKKLTLSVSLLNSSRTELAFDFDGSIPDYNALNDAQIEDAYFAHLSYITNQLNPDYLILAIEVNELLVNAPEKWDSYKLLMAEIRSRIKAEFPTLQISESITLHNFYNPDVENPNEFIEEISNYANSLDLVTISFYPFFKGLKTKAEFQQAFDFLHEKITKPIAFSETSHLSEDLTVESFDLFIAGNQSEQNAYQEALFTNAQENDYEYLIWWAHRDYDELWETFPVEAKDLGKLWISTGIINEDGEEKESYATWDLVFNK